MPPAPSGAPASGALAGWQVDALVRRRLAEATKRSVHHLNAIVKLVDDIPSMRVGVEVQTGVNKALEELELVSRAFMFPHISLSHQRLPDLILWLFVYA